MWIGDGPLRDKLTSANITVTGFLARKDAIRNVKEGKTLHTDIPLGGNAGVDPRSDGGGEGSHRH